MARINRAVLRQMRTQKSKPFPLPAPVGGWNTISALADMPIQDAIKLDNWYPELGKVRARKGYTEHATGVGSGSVDTVVEYHVGSTRQLLACSSSTIYDATSTGASSSIQAGFTNGRWQVASFGGSQKWVNGQDTPQIYDGSTFTPSTINGSGLTATALNWCHVHNNRMYTGTGTDQYFWYGGTSAIQGTFTKFDVGLAVAIKGNVIGAGTWTVDAGNGVQDVLVLITSGGQAVAYSGSDPGDADNFALVGVYPIGAGLGPRALATIGADLRITTMQDYESLTEILRAGRGERAKSKVQAAVAEAAMSAPSEFGWQSIVYPRGGLILHNVPRSDGTFHQHVQNLTTGAWCRYTGIVAYAWGLYGDDLYFGGDGGIVYKAETDFSDDGDTIQCDAQGAWTDGGDPNRKRIAAYRAILGITGTADYTFALGYDFRDPVVPTPTTITSGGAEWDESFWDITSWSPENVTKTGWRVASGDGVHVSPRLRVATESEVNWYRYDVTVESASHAI